LKTLPRTFGAIDFEQFAALKVSEALWLHGLGRRLSCNLVAYRVPLASKGSRQHLCRVAQAAKLNRSQLRLLAASEVQFDPSIAIVAYRAPWKKRLGKKALRAIDFVTPDQPEAPNSRAYCAPPGGCYQRPHWLAGDAVVYAPCSALFPC
jgi:hypothetical protein